MAPDLAARLALVAVYSLVVVALFVGVPILTWRSRPLPTGTLRLGGMLAGLVLALQLPGIVTYALYYDPRMLLEDELAPPLVHAVAPDLAWAMFAASLGSAVVMGLWRVVAVPAAELLDEASAFPVALRREARPWGSAFALGLGLGLLGVAATLALGAGPDSIAREAPGLFPGLPTSWPTRLALGLTGGLAAAVSEELLFRGVLQRALLRWLPVPAAIAIAAAVVGCGKAVEPHLPWLAMAQGGVFSGALGALAHRHGLETSLVAHGVLVAVMTVGTLWA